jgi:hypothetical protein
MESESVGDSLFAKLALKHDLVVPFSLAEIVAAP